MKGALGIVSPRAEGSGQGTARATVTTTICPAPARFTLANRLDAQGHHVLADVADRAADMVSKFSDRRKAPAEPSPPVKPGHLSTLSTRYCPDHHGVQAIRVAERVYQGPIDGRMYDYEGGYVDYSGQRVPGGNIANQTPSSTPYALPQRLFDSRQNIINTIK